MATVIGITSVKQFTYRDDATEQFSNTYHFTGTPPATSAAWKAFYDALVQAERTILPSTVHFVAAYGYDSDDDHAHAVWSWEHTTETLLGGTYSPTPGAPPMAGDQAALMSWRTSRKNTRGKWIYLRKYMHGGSCSPTDRDKIDPALETPMQNVAQVLADGSWNAGHQLRSQKHDEVLQNSTASPWVTTRTLHRRGKRPRPAP